MAFTFLDNKCGAPGLGCLITIISTFIDNILFTVSIKDSPFFTDDCEVEKFNTSADNLFSANSNDNFVLVEFSKKRFAIVISLRDGTFLIGLLITSLKLSAVSNISCKSFLFKNLTPNK